MRKTFALIALLFATNIFAEDKSVDFEVKSGLEIIGAKEAPRIMFFLPPLELEMKRVKVKHNYFLNKTLLEEDLKDLLDEEDKDVSNIR